MASSYAAVNRRALCGFHHHHVHHNLTTGVMAYGISSLGAMMVIMMAYGITVVIVIWQFSVLL